MLTKIMKASTPIKHAIFMAESHSCKPLYKFIKRPLPTLFKLSNIAYSESHSSQPHRNITRTYNMTFIRAAEIVQSPKRYKMDKKCT